MIGQNIRTTFKPRMGARRPRMKGAQPNTIQPAPTTPPQTGKGGFGGSTTNPTPIPGQPAAPAPTATPFSDPTAPRTPPPAPAQPPPAATPPPSHGDGKGDFGGSISNPHPVKGDGTPNDQQTGPKGDPSIDDLIEQNIRKYMSGGDDTEAEQKALADQENAALSHALVNQRARMGRAGFGSSGALAGMENDARSAAARQLALDQIGIREREQQQGFDRFQGAAGTDINERRLAQEQADADARLAFLKTIVGGGPDADPGAAPDGGGGPSTRGPGRGGADVNLLDPSSHVTTDSSTLADAGGGAAATTENPNDPNLPTSRTKKAPGDQAVMSTPTYDVYRGADGHLYRVNKG